MRSKQSGRQGRLIACCMVALMIGYFEHDNSWDMNEKNTVVCGVVSIFISIAYGSCIIAVVEFFANDRDIIFSFKHGSFYSAIPC